MYKKTSPYYLTPVDSKFSYYYVPRPINPNSRDGVYTIESKYHKRPDLLSYDLFGTVYLWWVFAARNMEILQDPVYDFVTGKTIMVPYIDEQNF